MSSSLKFLSSNSLRFPILASPCLYTHKRNSSPTFLPSHLPCSIFSILLTYLHHSYQIASNFVLHTTIDNFANSHFFTFSWFSTSFLLSSSTWKASKDKQKKLHY
jgi:hypothetical protein